MTQWPILVILVSLAQALAIILHKMTILLLFLSGSGYNSLYKNKDIFCIYCTYFTETECFVYYKQIEDVIVLSWKFKIYKKWGKKK